MAAEGLRQGRTYGTIVVDLERRRGIDLLPGRSRTTVANWLQQRPGIEVVARDRSTEYARAAAIGAPKAVQVGPFPTVMLVANSVAGSLLPL